MLFLPVALVARLASLPDIVVFAASALGLAPLAAIIGRATEELAEHVGGRFGGLLNATFGNAAELIITAFAIQRGLLTLAKASITGSIIGNTLLVLGVSLLAGGLKRGKQRFDARETSLNAAMMILAVAGLYLPAVFTLSDRDNTVVESFSLIVAGVLIVTYLAYLVYTVVQGHPRTSRAQRAAEDARTGEGAETDEDEVRWGLRRSLLVLAGATAAASLGSELLVGAVEPVVEQLGWSELFIGVVVVAIVGNAAEHFSAAQMAIKGRLEITFGIAAGSSTQIALLVAPVLVFLSLALGHPMDLVFTPLELAIIGLAVAIFAYLSIDGESNWLEGVQLLAVYVIAACAFFLLPFQRG
jgi:Ca2+:H+ antiporter